ncbi:MAG: hypothetical protein FJ215_03330 [Ignavibacteria bacterium]|nr:hypothetical protein [Ignavibacteria bacterium]
MNKHASIVFDNRTEFLYFLRSRFRLYHKSNLFLRDLHYGVSGFLEQYGVRLSYHELEETTQRVIGLLVSEAILKEIDARTWMLNYEEFQKLSAKAPKPSTVGQDHQKSANPSGVHPGTQDKSGQSAMPSSHVQK